ncbi:TRAP transporter large permease [Pseudaminobacter sp. 19-2017]|uniref:TRAP transporter large permease n=1 Tax=Pseudaminobacter soli (ex Zhang et al. 2022) TaxID=2831468 RepID=A0A942E198_9HYPH|nr:TRAP transporter large permease [Pseudaminobacter soli]MBS3651984.1 TRAP transporter large permease [Pseudaminobacter soli]
MTEIQIGFAGLAILLLLLAIRIPIGLALIGVSYCGIWALVGWNVAWGAIGIIPYQFSANWVLSSVPMFLLLGFVSYHAQLTKGLFDAAKVWLSGLPGGLAISAVLGSSAFAAVCGSSVACSAAMGRIAVPEMMRARYHPELATGTVAVAGTIGALIPPSILMILYGVIARQPVPQLFLGGFAIGILSAIAYIVVVLVRVKLNPALAPRVVQHVPFSEKMAALADTWPILLVMIGIFAGLFGGVFTATEAGAVGAFLACVVGVAKRALTWRRFKAAAIECLLTTSALIIIGVGASLFTRFLAISGVGSIISDAVLGVSDNEMVIIMMIVAVYLVLGCFLEPIGAMLLTLPIVLPIVSEGGHSLIWFGVLLTKLLEIGMITPPIGMNVFVIKGVVGNLVSLTAIFRGVMWFLAMDLFLVVIMVLFPQLTLAVPQYFLN